MKKRRRANGLRIGGWWIEKLKEERVNDGSREQGIGGDMEHLYLSVLLILPFFDILDSGH